jgi:hypothetical protein
LEQKVTDAEQWKEFYKKHGMNLNTQDTSTPDWIQVSAVQFMIANKNILSDDILCHTFFVRL